MKPDQSSSPSSSSIHLQSSDHDPTSYDLSLSESGEKYGYQGVRITGDGQYILIFDPVKKHFVLHRVDSTFDMNLVSAPWTQDESNLRSEYPQIESEAKIHHPAPQRKVSKGTKKAPVAKIEAPRKKAEKPKKPKAPVREPTPDDDDSDDVLTIEYPGGPSSQQHKSYISTPMIQTHISEESDEDEDAEHDEFEEEHNQDVDHLKLPSPAGHTGELSDEELQLDLEAELEQALQADQSSESEEE